MHDAKYFIPLTSLTGKKMSGTPLPKNSLVFRKIDDGNRGGIHIGNMIPVPEECLHYVNFDEIDDEKYRDGMKTQYPFIVKEWMKAKADAQKLYKL